MKRPFVDWVLLAGVIAGGIASVWSAIVVLMMSK